MAQENKTNEEFIEEIKLLEKRITELETGDIERKQQQQQQQQNDEHKQFKELFDHMSSGVAIYEAKDNGEDFIFKEINKSGEHYSKVSREEIVGKSVLQVFSSVKKMGLFEVFRQVWKTGNPQSHPVSLYQDDHVSQWVENYVYKLPSGEIVAIYDDVTDRKNAEEALQESEKRFKDVLYASKDAILLIDANIFVDCNEATALMLGYLTREEFLMTHPSKLSPDIQPDGRNSFEKAEEMMRIALEKGYNRFEWIHKKANGEDFLVEASLTPVLLNGKTVIHCVWRDLTDIKKIEETAQKHVKELEVFYKASVGREERIIELKNKVTELEKKLGV